MDLLASDDQRNASSVLNFEVLSFQFHGDQDSNARLQYSVQLAVFYESELVVYSITVSLLQQEIPESTCKRLTSLRIEGSVKEVLATWTNAASSKFQREVEGRPYLKAPALLRAAIKVRNTKSGYLDIAMVEVKCTYDNRDIKGEVNCRW